MEENFILENVIPVFIDEFLKISKPIFRDIKDNTKQIISNSLKHYFEKCKIYLEIKTFLSGSSTVSLYDVFYPLRIFNENEEIITDNIQDVFKRSNHITIIGDAGSGKSTLLKHLFFNCIKNNFNIPISIELRHLNNKDSLSFSSFIRQNILKENIVQNESILDRFLIHGKFVFFFDGFDELSFKTKSRIQYELRDFILDYNKNNYVISSRPLSEAENIPHFHNYYISKLDFENGEVFGFIKKQLPTNSQLSDDIISYLSTRPTEFERSFITNPLLLTIYILTFSINREVPSNKSLYYRRVLNALFSEHDSKTKFGYKRERATGLPQEKLEEVQKRISFITYFDGKTEFDHDYINSKLEYIKKKLDFTFENEAIRYDFINSVGIWTLDSGMITYSHRSLQEYFTALKISSFNPTDKERFYKKLLNDTKILNSSIEIENFLEICKEIDSYSFYKFFQMNVLHYLKSIFLKNSNEELIIQFFLFLIDSFIVTKDENEYNIMAIDFNMLSKPYHYIIKDFISEFISNIGQLSPKEIYSMKSSDLVKTEIIKKIETKTQKYFRNNSPQVDLNKNRQLLSGNERDRLKSVRAKETLKISFSKKLPELLRWSLITTNNLNLIDSTRLKIEGKATETALYIQNTLEQDEEFIDLI